MQAGKPKSEYSTHYTMSEPGPRGVVVCPYLLSLECRYCHELGHTPKYCPKAKSNNDRRAWRQAAVPVLVVGSPKTPIRPIPAHIPFAPKKLKPTNLFDCLDDDIEGDEDNNDRMKMFKVEKKAEKIEEFPSLGKKVKKDKKGKNPEAVLSTTSWAQITNHKPVDDCVLSAAPKQEERNLEQERLDIEHTPVICSVCTAMADKIIEKMQSNTHTSDDAWNESSFGGPLRTYGLDDDNYWGYDNNTSHMGDDSHL
jgi:hypothetical protein